MPEKDYQKDPVWFVPGWFKPTTELDIRNAKTLCNIIAKKQTKLE